MMMNNRKLPLGNNTYEFQRFLMAEESAPLDRQGQANRLSLLRTLAENVELLSLDGGSADEISIYHNGTRWVAELSRIGEEK